MFRAMCTCVIVVAVVRSIGVDIHDRLDSCLAPSQRDEAAGKALKVEALSRDAA